MKTTRLLVVALAALFSFGALVACDAKDLEKKANEAMDGAKDKLGDLSLDGLKKKFDEFGIAGIESKAKELGKLDLPAIKNLLTEKLQVEKLMEGINAENMAARLKELMPKIENLGPLVEKAKAALGM